MLLGSPAPAFRFSGIRRFLGYWRGTVADMNETLHEFSGAWAGVVRIASRPWNSTASGCCSAARPGGIGQAVAARLADAGAKLVLSSQPRSRSSRRSRKALPGGARRHKVVVSDLAEERGGGEADPGRRRRRRPRRERRPARQRPAGGLLTERDPARALRVNLEAPILMSREFAPALAEEGRGSHRLDRLARREGRARRAPPSTTRRSSGCAASPSASARTCTLTGSASRSSRPGFVRDAGMFHDAGSDAAAGLRHDDAGEGGRGGRAGDRARTRSRSPSPPGGRAFVTEIGYRHPEARLVDPAPRRRRRDRRRTSPRARPTSAEPGRRRLLRVSTDRAA